MGTDFAEIIGYDPPRLLCPSFQARLCADAFSLGSVA